MYTPPAYAETDVPRMLDLARRWSFGTLISATGGQVHATHLPFLVDPGGTEGLGVLTTHEARANPQWEALEGQEALVIFQGPQAFVSVNWYDNQLTFPTWNYAAIHAYGTVRLERDPEALRALLRRVIDTYDGPVGGMVRDAWRFDDMPEEMIAPRLRAIVGISVDITRLEGKLKFNQDKSAADRAGVIAALDADPATRPAAQFMQELEAARPEAEGA